MDRERDRKETELRQRAEKLAHDRDGRPDPVDFENLRDLIHELQVHQIELELQNEDLRATQTALEEARAHYAALYHGAPVGYVVLTDAGIVKEANETLGHMVGREARTLQGSPFPELLTAEDAAVFRGRFRSFFKNPAGKSMEVRVRKGAGDLLHALLEAIPRRETAPSPEGEPGVLLMTVSDITGRRQAELRLERALKASRAREAEVSALLTSARAILDEEDFQTAAKRIFTLCRSAVGAGSGYLALPSAEGREPSVLLFEAEGLPSNPGPNALLPFRELQEEVIAMGTPVFRNTWNGTWGNLFPKAAPLQNVLLTPLVAAGKAMGMLGLANKREGFSEADALLARGFAELVAIALQKDRRAEEKNRIEEERLRLIAQLQDALSNVKQLSGLIPICMHCKKIRDDTGYWNQLEAYITRHSDVLFSHSLCPECARRHYPGFHHKDDPVRDDA